MSLSVTAWSQDSKGHHGKFTLFDAPGAGTAPSQGTSVAGFTQDGVIVGSLAGDDDILTGYLRRRDGSFVTFSDPSAAAGAAFGAIPSGVNSNDQVVGIYQANTANYLFTSFERNRSDAFTDIHAPGATPAGIIDTWAYGINARGEITGQYFLANGTNESFVRLPNGTFEEFTAPNAVSTNAVSINDGGSVTGSFTDSASNSHGFVRLPGGFITDFDAPGAGTGASQGTSPLFINSSGTIVGSFIDASSATHGFVRDRNGVITVVDVPGAVSTTVSGVSGSQIAGTSVDAGGVSHGFVRDSNGHVRMLDAPGAGTAGGEGTAVVGIADEGLVIGYETDSNDVSHGFVWRSDDD